MNILISGGTGLVGVALVSKLRNLGHEVRVLVREKSNISNEFYWNVEKNEIDEKAFENLNAIIHLAGASIFQKWSEKNKRVIIFSRVDTADFLRQKVEELNIQLQSFISASGINYYGTLTSDKIFTENYKIARRDFLSDVCEKWEHAALDFKTLSERVVIFRISPVFSKKGGSFEQLKKVTNLNLAAALGSGKQWFPWIHLEDLIQLLIEAIENPKMNGIYNAVADEIPTNKELMKTLAKKSGKFFFPIRVPKLVLQLILGEMSEMILEGSKVSNQKLKSEGFQFQYPDLDTAFNDLLNQ